LPDERSAELTEVRLEVADEVRGVCLFARQRRLAVDDQTARTEQTRE
jgi:hypothetical protein